MSACSIVVIALVVGAPVDGAVVANTEVEARPADAETVRTWQDLRRRRRQATGMTAGGFAGVGVLLAASFPFAIANGDFTDAGGPGLALLVPGVGPLVLAGTQGAGNGPARALYVVDGLAQIGLLSVGIAGAVMRARTRRLLSHSRFRALDLDLARRLDEDPGLARRGRLGLGLSVGGFVGFAISWFAAFGAFTSEGPRRLYNGDDDVRRFWAFVPLVGPFALASEADLAGTKALGVTLGCLQVGTLAVGMAGAVIRGARVREGERRLVQELGAVPGSGGPGRRDHGPRPFLKLLGGTCPSGHVLKTRAGADARAP